MPIQHRVMFVPHSEELIDLVETLSGIILLYNYHE